jgi:hypothetical protein
MKSVSNFGERQQQKTSSVHALITFGHHRMNHGHQKQKQYFSQSCSGSIMNIDDGKVFVLSTQIKTIQARNFPSSCLGHELEIPQVVERVGQDGEIRAHH